MHGELAEKAMQRRPSLLALCSYLLVVVYSPTFTIFYFHIPAINCGDSGTPTNSQRTLSSTTYNSVVTYTCDVGYTLQGSNSRTCQSNGQWSGSVPQCTRMLSSIHIVFSTGVHKSTMILSYLFTFLCSRLYQVLSKWRDLHSS